MQFVIVGGGAIGGSFGAHLVRAGYEVLIVESNADHVRAMREDGLRMEGREQFAVRIPSVTPDEMPGAMNGKVADIVVLAVKSQHTAAALRPMLPYLEKQSIVLSMQNGLNPHLVADIVGEERTMAAAINQMATDYLEPGRIMFGGPGTIHVGEMDGSMSGRLERITAVIRDTYVENTTATDNILGYLWGKVCLGAMLFATAVSDDLVADTLSAPENLRMLGNLSGEVIAVAEACGVHFLPFDGYEPDAMRFSPQRDWNAIAASLAVIAGNYRRSHKPRTGIWRDLTVRRRKTEADGQFGPVFDLAQRHHRPLPLLTVLIDLIHELEDGRCRTSGENLQRLREADARNYPVTDRRARAH